jgi:hypothetical protein
MMAERQVDSAGIIWKDFGNQSDRPNRGQSPKKIFVALRATNNQVSNQSNDLKG